MGLSRAPLALLSVLLMLGSSAPSRGAVPTTVAVPSDGFLSLDVQILVYPADPEFESAERAWTLRREISLFEGYLWRYSDRHLSVNAHLAIRQRSLQPEEFRDYGARFGFLLDRSPRVDSDLRALGIEPRFLILVYDPPPDRPGRLAGRTFLGAGHSSVPLSPRYFESDGFSRPLHLVLVHEFLHQIDIAFSQARHPSEFLDPDGVERSDYPACIDRRGEDWSMRSLLRYNRSCQPIDWQLLATGSGTWVGR